MCLRQSEKVMNFSNRESLREIMQCRCGEDAGKSMFTSQLPIASLQGVTTHARKAQQPNLYQLRMINVFKVKPL